MKPENIASLFGLDGISDISEMNGGHINRTYLVTANDRRYVLQSLNGEVFRYPERVMANIAAVEGAFARYGDGTVTVPDYLKADGKNFVTVGGELWRCYLYTEPEDTNADTLYLTGRAFGTFIRVINQETMQPKTVIDGFHDFKGYHDRLKSLSPELAADFDGLRHELGSIFTDDMPRRVIHGDARRANVLTGRRCTVLDLDTVMSGYAALDYGDMIRSVCPAHDIDLDAVRSVTVGFAEGLGGMLTENEVGSLYYGILWLTDELAMRYFIDGIGKFGYFHNKTPEECLVRAEELRSQGKMIRRYSREIRTVIDGAFGRY